MYSTVTLHGTVSEEIIYLKLSAFITTQINKFFSPAVQQILSFSTNVISTIDTNVTFINTCSGLIHSKIRHREHIKKTLIANTACVVDRDFLIKFVQRLTP